MNQNKVIIVLAVLTAGLAAVLAFVLGRSSMTQSPAEPPGNVQANQTTISQPLLPAPKEAPPPVPPKADPNSDAELRRWIVGGWNFVSAGCENDGGEFFSPDGRYGNFDEEGRWRIEGSRIIFTITHVGDDEGMEMVPLRAPRVGTVPVRREGDNRMRRADDRMMRCPRSNHTFAS